MTKKQIMIEIKNCPYENELKLYNLCEDFISEINEEREIQKRKDLAEKIKQVPIGTKFKTNAYDTVYTVYKVIGTKIWFNWAGDKEGACEHIDNVLRIFERKIWIKVD